MPKAGKCCCCSNTPPDQYFNNPVVTVPNTSGGTSDIPAAMQPFEYCGYGPTGGCGLPSNWRDFCGQAYDGTNADAAIPCGTAGGPSVEGRNVFTLNPDYVWKKRCQLPGWKAVAAMRPWPGRDGFLTGSACCPNAKGQTRYLGIYAEQSLYIGASNTYSETDLSNGSATFSGYAEQKYTGSVDAYGNRSGNAYGRSGIGYNDSVIYNPDGSTIATQVDYQDECGDDGYFNAQNNYGSQCGYIYTNISGDSILVTPVLVEVNCGQIVITLVPKTGPQVGYFTGTADELNAAQLCKPALNSNHSDDGTQTVDEVQSYDSLEPLHVVSLTDTEIVLKASGAIRAVRTVTRNYDGAILQHIEQTYSWQFNYIKRLSTPFTWQDVQTDCKSLLDTWKMGDPEIYPWRQDGKVWLLPLVTRDCGGGGPDGAIPGCATDWSSTYTPSPGSPAPNIYYGRRAAVPRVFSENGYTGKIIGAPQPIRYGRWFNFRQKVVCTACGTDLVIKDNNWFCTSGWGQLSYDPLPETATQWTDAEMGSLLTEGAYCIQYLDSCLMAKYAEVLMPWPSVNFARPFGRDRFMIDYANVSGDSNCGADAGVSMENVPNVADDSGLIFYTEDIITDPANNLYAHRKFPNCRAIGSAIGIASAVDNGDGTVTLTTSETHWLCGNGDGHGYTDLVDFYNVPNLGSGVTVQVATPGTTSFTVNGSLTDAYTSGGFVASTGMTADLAKWDWTCPRRQFCVQEWDVNPRKYGDPNYKYTETQVQIYPKTGYSVALCSPNADTFPDDNWVYSVVWKDIDYEPCSTYFTSATMGNKRHTKFLQAVADPFFIAPVKCASDPDLRNFKAQPFCTHNEFVDVNGDGENDFLYSRYALVEPMTQLPPGAPTPQVDIPFLHDTGVPYKVAVQCAFPADRTPTLAMFNSVYVENDCLPDPDWKTVTHETCPANNFALPLASGYVPPTTGTTPPEAQTTTDGAGSKTGGAGDTVQPGAGDSNSGGLI